MENPSDLVFDTKLPVVPQYEHIFDDEENVQRLPSAVRESGMRVQLFDGALQQTRRILESDYKAAIPQYYNHSIQLLIPICLQNPGIPDLALACMKTPDGTKYLGRTCLTLRMAYHLSLIHISATVIRMRKSRRYRQQLTMPVRR